MNKRDGFTLIETIIYLGLLMLVIGGLLIVTYQIIESTSRNQLKVDVGEEGAFLIQKIEWGMSGATAISVPASTTLQITKSGIPAAQNPLLFTLNSQNLELKRGSNASTPLNSKSVSVTSIVFTDIPAFQNIPEAVQATITLKSQTYSQSFDTKIYLRK